MYEVEIEKLEKHLPHETNAFAKLQQMDALRYYYKENEKDEDRVKYNVEIKDLEYSKSIKMGIEITKYVPKKLHEIEEENRIKAIEIMKNNYYYLAGYLFSYYAVAIEFGIAPEKQFLAPRTSVLGPIAKKLERFYYKPKGVMTISMPQGTGKEQPLSSNILTPDGWIKMGEVKVGTKVIAADGSVCNVTGVYPKGVKDVYRVSFQDGTYVDCGLEHLWEVKTREDRNAQKKAKIVTTKEMIEKIKIKDKYHVYNNYSIRLVKPIKFKSKLKDDDIHPYILGTLIANGSLSQNNITFSTADEEVIEKVKKNIPQNCKVTRIKTKYVYGLNDKQKKRNNLGRFEKSYIMEKIEEYGLANSKSETKFIPQKFLYSSIKERKELLQGLLDGDGSITETGTCTYHTTSERLKDDILELIRGLGGKASYCKKATCYKDNEGKKKKCKDCYQINFTLSFNPFYLERKRKRYKKPFYNQQKMIVNIEKVREEECQCIMIDHPEHLYVTDGYTLTHNTELGKRFMSFCVGKAPDLPRNDGFLFRFNSKREIFFGYYDIGRR